MYHYAEPRVSVVPASVLHNPGMAESLLDREPEPGVGAHQPGHEVLGLLAHVAPEVVVELVLPPDDHPQQLGL